MSIDIKELYKSDLDPSNPALWWSSKKIEKLNWNFDQIKLSEGGPYGPQGFEGSMGAEGVTGVQGATGVKGFQGIQGVAGPKGGNLWTQNTSPTNITIKLIETKTNPANYRIGFADIDPEYSQNDNNSVKTFNTKDAATHNMIFIASNIDSSNTNLSSRKAVYFNLHEDSGAAVLESGFQNESDGNWKFRITTDAASKYSFLTPGPSGTELLELSDSKFAPKSDGFFGAMSSFNNTLKIGGNPGIGKVITTEYDINGDAGELIWKDVNEVLPTFPIGSIIAVDKEFTDTYFDLSKTGTIVDLGAVSGFPGFLGMITPTFVFTFGAGLASKKFKGWYLCNGKTWYKGSVSYTLPNLCSFDLNVQYPTFTSSILTLPPDGVGLLEVTTTNREFLGSAQVEWNAIETATAGVYEYNNGTIGQMVVNQSYIDLSEPLVQIYKGSTTTNQIDTSTGKGDGLVYLCFLGEEGFVWDTAATVAAVNSINLSYSASGYGTACGATATSYDCNFTTSTWTEASTWSTVSNALYVSGSSSYAASGWYASGGVARYWNNATGTFTSRMNCPSYTGIQLVYNSAVINSGINGSFSGLSKSTYYIDGTSLSNSSGLYTNSTGTSMASVGWYRDSGSRRYWNGYAFEGAIFTSDYVYVIDTLAPLGYGTTASSACNQFTTIYGYYQSSSSSPIFYPFSTISYLYVGASSAGSGSIDYANSSYYYSDASISRKCNNSSTGALNVYASCSTTPSSPSGGTGGGCVLFGTKITMNDGSTKQVQDLCVGDELSSITIKGLPMIENTKELYDWSSSSLDLYDEDVRVISMSSYNVNVVLSFNDGKLFTTKDHLHVYKSNGIWKVGYAIDVNVGDFLLGADKKEIEISSIVESKGSYIVYKVDVEENDMFIANGILTHNKIAAVE